MPQVSTRDFASRVRAKFPMYSSVDDSTLVSAFLEKYPDYNAFLIPEVPQSQVTSPGAISNFINQGFVQPFRSIMAGVTKGQRDIFKNLDAFTVYLEDKFGIPRGGAFEDLSKLWDRWAKEHEEKGVAPDAKGFVNEVARAVYEGGGRLATDLPVISTMGLTTYMATMGAGESIQRGESPAIGALKGGAQGALLHGSLKGLATAPRALAIAGGGAVFGVPSAISELQLPPEQREAGRVAGDIFLGAGLIALGQRPTQEQFRAMRIEVRKPLKAPERPAEVVKPEIRPEVPVEVEVKPVEAPKERVPVGTINTKPGAVKAFLQRNFTSRGNLPKEVFARKVSKEAIIGAELQKAEFVTRELARELKKTPVQADVIDSALKGEVPIETLPEPIRAPVSRMRGHIDALSRRMIEEGVVEGDMVAVIERNLDVYTTRSYRAFDDPLWSEKVTVDVRNKAKALVRQESAEMLQNEYSQAKGVAPEEAAAQMEVINSEAWTYRENRISGIIESLLFEGKAADTPIALIKKGNLGSKDLSILKPRKAIAPEIRALWGEYKDPLVNYTRSVSKMTHLIENQKFLTDVRSEGVGVFFHENPVVIEGVEYKTRIAAKGSDVMSPLNGLYTTPEIKTAFKDVMEPQNTGAMLSAYMKVNGTVKFAKTVGSVMTHIRNVLGNTGFAVANAHFRVKKAGVSFNTVMSSLAGDRKSFQEKYLKYQRLGLVHESARAGELMDVIKDARKGDIADFSELNAVHRAGEKALKVVTEIYRAEDDVWKIYAFENEVSRYKKALPEVPIEQIEVMAAEIVRNTYPTYSLVPRGIKLLRRFPLVGTFVSFPAEVIRTIGNTMSLATKEIRSANPQIRAIGSQRIAGMIVAATATAGATATSRFIQGMTKDDDEDAREFVPPWSKNSDILWLGEKDGNRLWIDLSYTDPYSYIKAPLQAFLRGDTWEDKIVEASLEAFEPFLGEEILSGAITDIARNKTETGGRVYNPESSWNAIALDVIQHMGESFTPGTVSSLNRIQKGLRGVVEPYGKTYNPKIEAMATFTGHRINSLDVSQGLSFKARGFTKGMRDATQILTGVLKNKGAVSEGEIIRAYGGMEISRKKIFSQMQNATSAARALGMSENEVLRLLKDNGLSASMAWAVLNGLYQPYQLKISQGIPPGRRALVKQLTVYEKRR